MHATVAVGRFPTAIHSLVAGAGIVDFELDPFDPQRVFIASDDSRIRVFKVPNAGLKEDMTDVAVTLTGESRFRARLAGTDAVGQIPRWTRLRRFSIILPLGTCCRLFRMTTGMRRCDSGMSSRDPSFSRPSCLLVV